jgi:cobalt-zinc-cadmium efflux system protein
VIAAFVNGLALIFISLWIIVEAGRRFFAPVPVKGLEMLIVAVAGLLVNLLIGLILKSTRTKT